MQAIVAHVAKTRVLSCEAARHYGRLKMCWVLHAGQVMFDPYAGALTSVQLPEGTNVAPPKAGGSPQNGAGAPGNPPAVMGCLSVLADTFDFGNSQR